MLNLYIQTDNPVLAWLDGVYNKLFPLVEAMVAAHEVADKLKANRVSGGKKPSAIKDMPTWYDRERCYEAGCMELARRVKLMHPFLEPVRAECQQLRAQLVTAEGHLDSDLLKHMRANILIAEQLCNTAAEYYFGHMGCQIIYAHSMSTSVTDELFKGSPANAREWVTMSSGHGSRFRYDEGEGTQVPPAPYLTAQEANLKGWNWEVEGDMIGVVAKIYNVRTGQTKLVRNPAK